MSEASQAREAQKNPQVACAWRIGGPQIAASAFRTVFGDVCDASPIIKSPPIELCQCARPVSQICTFLDLFCGPPCATQLMQPQCEQGLSLGPMTPRARLRTHRANDLLHSTSRACQLNFDPLSCIFILVDDLKVRLC